MKNRFASLLIAFTLAFGTAAFAEPKTDDKSAKSADKKSKAPAAAAPSDADIAAAQKAGKVWVNTESKVYHKSGRWYGKTKQGKFMSETDAMTMGYHEDKGEAGKAGAKTSGAKTSDAKKSDAKKSDPKKK